MENDSGDIGRLGEDESYCRYPYATESGHGNSYDILYRLCLNEIQFSLDKNVTPREIGYIWKALQLTVSYKLSIFGSESAAMLLQRHSVIMTSNHN